MRVVLAVVVTSSSRAGTALLLVNRQVLNISSTAVAPADIIDASVTVESSNIGTTAAGPIRTEVLQDICLA